MKLRPEVQRFAEEMEKQLRKNEHKGGWKNCSYDFLRQELYKNYYELNMLLEHPGGNLVEIRENVKKVVLRCANIGNFAMMISDNCGGMKDG